MAGHSHWANIARKKSLIDAKRGKLWSKLAKAIIVAAKHGGADPGTFRLRSLAMKASPLRTSVTATVASACSRRERRRSAWMPRHRCALVAALVASFLGLSNAAIAQTLWKAGNDDNLNLTSSWFTTETGSTNPASITTSSTLRFGGSGQGATRTLSLGGDLSVNALQLDNQTGSPNYSVTINSGNTLTLNQSGGNGILLNSGNGGSMTINCDVTVAASHTWTSSRTLTVGGAVGIGGNTLSFNTAGSAVITLSGSISGAGSLNKSAGTGTLVLSNSNSSFAGTVTLVGGNTQIASLANGGVNSSLGNGSSAIVMNGAAMTYTGVGNGSTNRAIDMRAGATINNNSATGTIAFTAANVTQGGAATARTLTLGGSNTGNNVFGSIIGDSGVSANITTLTKSNAGTWVLTGVNTYTGATVINQGTLRVTGAGRLGGVAGVTTDAGNTQDQRRRSRPLHPLVMRAFGEKNASVFLTQNMTNHCATPRWLRALRSVFRTAWQPPGVSGPTTARQRWDGGSGFYA